VPPQGGRKHPHQDFIQINTQNILFICGGAFEGLDKIVEKRLGSHKTMGFKAAPGETPEMSNEALAQLIPDDLLKFGLIPEFVGRLPVSVSLDNLDRDALVRILTEPKNAIIKQYQKLMHLDRAELVFTDDALEAAADSALKQKTGARGLRTIIEDVLLDVMFEIPSRGDVKKVIIDGETIARRKSAQLVTRGEARAVELEDESA
jgi:ATP-dependent Clp protease ATP-binding subunit ClpX